MAIFALAYWAVEVKGWARRAARHEESSGPGSSSDRMLAAYMVSELIPGINDLFHVTSNGQAMSPLGGARSYLRSHTRPRLGLLRLFRLLCGSLLYPGLDPLSQEDLIKV